jgi:YD repeat-containing protein
VVTFNSRNELQHTGFGYDNNGNTTNFGGVAQTFDAENRMTSYSGSSFTAGYRADGLRAWKSHGGTTTYFIYDAFGTPLLETQLGSVSAENTFGPLGLVSRYTNGTGTSVFYQFDPQGNTVTRTDRLANVLDYHSFDPGGGQFSSAVISDPYAGYEAQYG